MYTYKFLYYMISFKGYFISSIAVHPVNTVTLNKKLAIRNLNLEKYLICLEEF